MEFSGLKRHDGQNSVALKRSGFFHMISVIGKNHEVNSGFGNVIQFKEGKLVLQLKLFDRFIYLI